VRASFNYKCFSFLHVSTYVILDVDPCFVGKRTLTGSAKEKAHTRDALKANRKAKEERRAHHVRSATFNVLLSSLAFGYTDYRRIAL
jgi:hypothetical protein